MEVLTTDHPNGGPFTIPLLNWIAIGFDYKIHKLKKLIKRQIKLVILKTEKDLVFMIGNYDEAAPVDSWFKRRSSLKVGSIAGIALNPAKPIDKMFESAEQYLKMELKLLEEKNNPTFKYINKISGIKLR